MKLLRFLVVFFLVACAAVAINVFAIPTHNTEATHFDTILVLGYPANGNGTPSPEQRERVLEGVREYKAGVATHILMTGGAAHNQFVEAHVMAVLAEAQGVPASDIVEEPQALNTIQNIYYSSEIMHARGWNSAEVISTPEHLPRAGMILTAFGKRSPGFATQWRRRAARWPPEYGLAKRVYLDVFEAGRCLEIRIFNFPDSKFLPRR